MILLVTQMVSKLKISIFVLNDPTSFSAPDSFLDQVGSEESPFSPPTSSPAENSCTTDPPPAGLVNIADLINESFVVRNLHMGLNDSENS